MKFSTLQSIAKTLGEEIEYKKYVYWENVPHIGNTALCFDSIEKGSKFFTFLQECTILQECEEFPKFVTKKYIIGACENNTLNLGTKINHIKKYFGETTWWKYDER